MWTLSAHGDQRLSAFEFAHPRSGALVAVKVISKAAAAAHGPHMVGRVVAEVETHSMLRHPNVVDLLVRPRGVTGGR